MSSTSLDPKRIFNKNVMTSDRYVHGGIVGTTEDSIIIMEGAIRAKRYIIPKSLIREYDGSYVHLTITESELSKYRK